MNDRSTLLTHQRNAFSRKMNNWRCAKNWLVRSFLVGSSFSNLYSNKQASCFAMLAYSPIAGGAAWREKILPFIVFNFLDLFLRWWEEVKVAVGRWGDGEVCVVGDEKGKRKGWGERGEGKWKRGLGARRHCLVLIYERNEQEWSLFLSFLFFHDFMIDRWGRIELAIALLVGVGRNEKWEVGRKMAKLNGENGKNGENEIEIRKLKWGPSNLYFVLRMLLWFLCEVKREVYSENCRWRKAVRIF